MFISILFATNAAKSQSYFGEFAVVGTSLSYYPIISSDEYGTYYGYHELVWNTNIGIKVSKHFLFGLQYIPIYMRELEQTNWGKFNMYGVFVQYFFRKNDSQHFSGYLSLNRSNYSLMADVPFQDDNRYYLGVGLNYDLPIPKIKNLHLDLAIIPYFLLNNIRKSDVFFQYVIGLNYRIKARK